MPQSHSSSRKVYVTGSRPDIRVPMREISLTGDNPPLRLYDTSGPYTDPGADLDLKRGLTPLRLGWIIDRGDVHELPGPTSAYRRSREENPALGGVRFASVRRPLRASPGRCVTQMHYARRGEITPEMEFIALREGVAPEFVRDEVARGRAIIPVEHQPSRDRADDHRPEVPGEDQRQHRELRGHLLDRGGGREDDLGDALGRRHGHGPVDRQEHPRDARVDPAQLAGADRHRADLPGAREGRRQGRGADLGDLPRHAHRAGRAGRRLLHDPRRRAPALHSADRQARHRHRVARRLDHGQVVPRAPPGELPLHALPGDLRDHGGVRRRLLAGRRTAPGLHRGRQRRGAVRRARHARRAHDDRVGARRAR